MSGYHGRAKKVFSLVADDGVNATIVKTRTGDVCGWHLTNTSEDPMYLKIYDLGSRVPDVGTDVPKQIIGIPGGIKLAGNNFDMEDGVEYVNGIAIALTVLPDLDDDTPVVATTVVVNLLYK